MATSRPLDATSIVAKTGGPAFPPAPAGNAPVQEKADFAGVTLRDWFAARAPEPPKWWEQEVGEALTPPVMARRRAHWAYLWADAMMAARQQGMSQA